MTKETERPEKLADAMQQAVAELVELGSSRRAAAAMLEIPPSAVSKRMLGDASFAEAVHAAEQFSEADLLAIMRKHCEKSWQATRWLLECLRPERYGKRKGAKALGPSVDEMFDAVIGVLTEEIADESLRGRIEARLDTLATREFFNAPAKAARQVAATAETSSEVADEHTDEANDQAEEQPDERLEKQSDQVAEELEPSEVSEHAAPEDAPLEPEATPVMAASVARPVKKPGRASPADIERGRRQAEEKRRLRKLRNKERHRQRKMLTVARKLKKSQRRRH